MEPVLGIVILLGSSVSARIAEHIIGGFECQPHSQPWQVYIVDDKLARCGGALISKEWVATAGHCIGRDLRVHIGEHNLETKEDKEQVSEVVQTIRHPEYEPENLKNDIMLLRLAHPAILGDTVKTIQIATKCAQIGTKCMVAGWGTVTPQQENYSDILLCANMTIQAPEICKEAYGKKFGDLAMCAGILEGGTDTCQGDSGGSLVCHGIFHGIVSSGAEWCGAKNKPGIYTEICKYQTWIKTTMAEN